MNLVEIACSGDPGLGLTYDRARSRTGTDDMVIALSPAATGDIEKRLTAVAAVIERAAANLPGVRRVVATVARAA